jgi:hypothetical protein
MMSYWAQFAYAGDPGGGHGGDLPRWEPWSAGNRMVFDTPDGGGARMESGRVGRAEVIAAVETDERLATPRAKCGVYRELAAFGRGFTPEQYTTGLSGACADYPYEAYPWK